MGKPKEPPPLRAIIDYYRGTLRVTFSTPGMDYEEEAINYPLGTGVHALLSPGSLEPFMVNAEDYLGLDLAMRYLIANLIGPLIEADVEAAGPRGTINESFTLAPEEAHAIRLAWIAIGRRLGHL